MLKVPYFSGMFNRLVMMVPPSRNPLTVKRIYRYPLVRKAQEEGDESANRNNPALLSSEQEDIKEKSDQYQPDPEHKVDLFI